MKRTSSLVVEGTAPHCTGGETFLPSQVYRAGSAVPTTAGLLNGTTTVFGVDESEQPASASADRSIVIEATGAECLTGALPLAVDESTWRQTRQRYIPTVVIPSDSRKCF
jgi:hypothetical protein